MNNVATIPPPAPRTALAAIGVTPSPGIAATAAALGVSELIAGVLPGATSLVAAIGQVIIDHQPPGAKDVVVALFGTNDKLAFEVVIVAVALVIGAGLGVLARRSFAVAAAIFAAFGVLGFLASLNDPLGEPGIVAVVGGDLGRRRGVGPRLAARARPAARPHGIRRSASTSSAAATPASMPDWSRRSFMIRAGARDRWRRRGRASPAGSLLERQRVAPAGAARPSRRPRCPSSRSTPTQDLATVDPGPDPDRHAQRPLLPDRHRAADAQRRHRDLERCGSTGWSTARRR